MNIRVNYISFFCALAVLLSINCKKEWGTEITEIYPPVDGPSFITLFEDGYYSISIDMHPNTMKFGSEVSVNVELSRYDGMNVNLDLYCKWDIIVEGYHRIRISPSRSIYTNINILHPTINGSLRTKGNKLYSVIVKTSDNITKNLFTSDQLLADAVDYFNKLTVTFNLGFENPDRSVKYFYKETLEIPIYY